MLCVVLAGCGEAVEAELEVGAMRTQGFVALADGDVLDIVMGLQGGYWTMPALRSRGLADAAVVGCSLTVAGATEPHAVATLEGQFIEAAGGWREIDRVPLFISYEDAEVRTFDQAQASVSCQAKAVRGLAAAEAAVGVVLDFVEPF